MRLKKNQSRGFVAPMRCLFLQGKGRKAVPIEIVPQRRAAYMVRQWNSDPKLNRVRAFSRPITWQVV